MVVCLSLCGAFEKPSKEGRDISLFCSFSFLGLKHENHGKDRMQPDQRSFEHTLSALAIFSRFRLSHERTVTEISFEET
jgi:hypothetical protein